jgi:hypothetical protein
MSNITLEEWNAEITQNLIPNIVILSLYLIIGVFGNLIVIAVYTFQMKEKTDERYFVPILAVCDMISASYISIISIYQNTHHVSFSSVILCQVAQFFVGLTTYIPILLLVIIAVQRYTKVCKPLRPPMPLYVKRCIVCIAFVFSILVAIPIPLVYGVVPFNTKEYIITGSRCGKVKEGTKLVRSIYGVVIGLSAFIIIIVLIGLYSKIGYTVYKAFKSDKYEQTHTRPELNIKPEVQESSTFYKEDRYVTSTTEAEDTDVNCDATSLDEPVATSNDISTNGGKEVKIKYITTKSRKIKNRQLTNKITMMFLVITIVFLLSYVPKVILLIIEGISPHFWEQLSNTQRPGIIFLYHMFIINNIANPFVYAFMDLKFRNNSKLFLQRICICSRQQLVQW